MCTPSANGEGYVCYLIPVVVGIMQPERPFPWSGVGEAEVPSCPPLEIPEASVVLIVDSFISMGDFRGNDPNPCVIWQFWGRECEADFL